MHSWTMACERPPRPLHQLRLRAIALALRAKVASRHLLDVASTPPHEEGNKPLARHFIHTSIDRRYSECLLGVLYKVSGPMLGCRLRLSMRSGAPRPRRFF